jgi:hypothetical protein
VNEVISVLQITEYAVVQRGVAAYLHDQSWMRLLHVASLDAISPTLTGIPTFRPRSGTRTWRVGILVGVQEISWRP